MPKSLIIVESPAKTKTLKGFLGRDFQVEASMGHVRDLPTSKLGVDVEKDFAPSYVAIPERREVLQKLARAAKDAEVVYLASDPDREGEAISWHLAQALKLKNARRIQFNEITKSAVQDALRHPRDINRDLVDAQQARRVLDRLVGYKISPLLWKKVKKNLSAGRVQSVAVRLICDREREIRAFVPEEYWSITATLTPQPPAKRHPFEAELREHNGKKIELKNKDDADRVMRDLEGPDRATYTVKKVKRSERQRRPYAPFITSTLQQEASRKLGFGARRAMSVAQQLYEGIDLGSDGGQVGLITYMRTDSTRIAAEAQAEAKNYIATRYGPEYAPERANVYKSRGSAQDAHEAIRPTSVFREPDAIRGHLSPDQYRLYRLIWLRFVASQMKPAILDVVTADIEANGYTFRATGSTVKFDGFLRVYTEGKDTAKVEDEERPPLPPLAEGQILDLLKLLPEQHFTEPPPRYTEATLVKSLEEQGIGRPSTYASIISTIQEREYVELADKKFQPTELGFVVTDLLVKHFPDILDVQFTAGIEDKLDTIEEGKQDWVALLRAFYGPFEESVARAEEGMERVKVAPKESDIPCPNCGRLLVERSSRFGKFLACPGYPECKYIHREAAAAPAPAEAKNGEAAAAPAAVTSEIPCPNCGRMLVERTGRFGKFLGCPGYPECKYIHREAPQSTGVTCPECKQGEIVEKRSKKGVFYGCSRYPDCKYTLPSKPVGRDCPNCGALLIERANRGAVTGVRCSNRECDYAESAVTAAGHEAEEPEALAA